MKNVIDHLQARGFIDQISSEELAKKLEKPTNVYVGFDPTAESLHLGNLVGILALVWLQKFGHTPYIITGGATARVGDPSGKSLERPFLDEKSVISNTKRIETFFRNIFSSSEGPEPVFLNNEEWLGSLSFVEFLRDVGKHFRIGPMLGKESVRTRMASEEGMSFTEFSYQILQAYDFYYLFHNHKVMLQMGGSDQWGNITAGIDFTRKLTGKSVYGLTFPLLTRSDGKKFGKTEDGAVWLSDEKLSPFYFYQYLVRIPDDDVIRLMQVLTFMEMGEIREIEKTMKTSSYVPNTAQKKLAEEVTRFVHGEEGLKSALRATDAAAPGSKAKLSGEILKTVEKDMPHSKLKDVEVVEQKYIDVLAKVGLVSSKSEAVRLVKNGGAYLNNERIQDPAYRFSKKDLIDSSYLLLSVGKKKKMLLEIISS